MMPHDMHMIESLVPRVAGGNVDGAAGSLDVIPNTAPWNTQTIFGPTPGPTAPTNANPNGSEYNTALEDLEYACIFPLVTARACACTTGSNDYASCKYLNPNDCCDQTFQTDGGGGQNGVPNYDKPLCNGTTQVAAKAYPGLREIAVLHDYATSSVAAAQGNSVVASICPKDLSTPASPGYGYNPAVSALVTRMKGALKGSCLSSPIAVNSNGSISCSVVEVVPGSNLQNMDCASYCMAEQRLVPSAAMVADVTADMRNNKICDNPGQPACSTLCVCQLPQENGNNLTVCQNADDATANVSLPPGFCYVDPANGAGSTAIVAKCPDTEKRNLRFVGNCPTCNGGVAVPLSNAYVFLSCGTLQ